MHIYNKAVDEYADENMLADNTNLHIAVVYHSIEGNMLYKIHLLKKTVKYT